MDKYFTHEGLMAASAAFIGFIFGGFTSAMGFLLLLNAVDIFSGLLVGTKDRAISSRRMTDGLKRKIGMWLLVILAHVIDEIAFQSNPIAKTGIVLVLCGNEGISISENVQKLGVKVPHALIKYLEHVKDNPMDELLAKVPASNKKETTGLPTGETTVETTGRDKRDLKSAEDIPLGG